MFSRTEPQSPTVEIKDELNLLGRQKILSEEIHVSRLAWCVEPLVCPHSPPPPPFQLYSLTCPPVELRDNSNHKQDVRKYWLDQHSLENIQICLVVAPFLSDSEGKNIDWKPLETPEQPCIDIKDEINHGRGNQKHLYEHQVQEIFIIQPECILSYQPEIRMFREDHILQKPPIELEDKIREKVGAGRRSLIEIQIVDISLEEPGVCVNYDGYLREFLFKETQQETMNIDINDISNKPSNKFKQFLGLEPYDFSTILILPVLVAGDDGTRRYFSISEPHPMELCLEDRLNITSFIGKIISDYSIECSIIIPEGFTHTSSIKLELEPFYDMSLPIEIEDSFKTNIFNSNRLNSSDEIPSSFPSTPNITAELLYLAPPQTPPTDGDRIFTFEMNLENSLEEPDVFLHPRSPGDQTVCLSQSLGKLTVQQNECFIFYFPLLESA